MCSYFNFHLKSEAVVGKQLYTTLITLVFITFHSKHEKMQQNFSANKFSLIHMCILKKHWTLNLKSNTNNNKK